MILKKTENAEESKDSETGIVLEGCKKLLDEMDEKTVGEYIWQQAQKHSEPPKRITQYGYEREKQIRKKSKEESLTDEQTEIERLGFYATREMYQQEFEKILTEQIKHHPILEKIGKDIEYNIFHQRPLQSQKNKVGNCNIYPRKKRCAIARLEFQNFRSLQVINNIRLNNEPLTYEQRCTLFELCQSPDKLNNQGRISWKEIEKTLGGNTNYGSSDSDDNKTGLPGNRTAKAIADIVGIEQWKNWSREQQQNLIEDLVSIINRKTLYHRLVNHWNLTSYKEFGDASTALQLTMNENIESGYGKHSLKAISHLLPHMRNGFGYYDAVEKIDKKNSITPDPQRYSEENFILDPEDVPNVANPIVQKALFEMRRVINTLIKRYGTPTIIRIEMAREMKTSKQHRAEISTLQKDNRKRNTNAETDIIEYYRKNSNPHITLQQTNSGLRRVSIKDRKKYIMWKYEQSEQCPYCQRCLNPHQLFSGEAEIEHILPYTGFRQNYMNTVVSCKSCNHEKGQRTPFQAWGDDESRWERIIAFVKKHYKGNLYPKLKNILKKEHNPEEMDNFVERQLNDTRYIATATKKMLNQYGVPVDVTTGMATSELRRRLGLNNIRPDKPDSSSYEEESDGILKFSTKNDEKKRHDHHHHAIDALVVALTDRNMLQKIVEAHQDEEYHRSKGKHAHSAKLQLPNTWLQTTPLRNIVNTKLNLTIVSHMSKQKIWGALHDATLYARSHYPDKESLNTSAPILKKIIRLTKAEPYAIDGWIHPSPIRDYLMAWAEKTVNCKPADRRDAIWNGKRLKSVYYLIPCATTRKPINECLKFLKNLPEQHRKVKNQIIWISEKSIHDTLYTWLKSHNLHDKNENIIKKALREDPPRIVNKENKPSEIIKRITLAKVWSDAFIPINQGKAYVLKGSNHHIVIFNNGKKDDEKERHVCIVSMLEAAKRKSRDQPIINKQAPEEWLGEWFYEMHLSVGDMVQWLGKEYLISRENFHPIHNQTPFFRVQAINSNSNTHADIKFRHHSVSGTNDNWGLLRIQSLQSLNCKPVQLGNLGLLDDSANN